MIPTDIALLLLIMVLVAVSAAAFTAHYYRQREE